ncbi:MAG: hypothetical protein U9R19_07450, partial [Bacteroidota bacterium]|nr:hypothetical protein [Bacteroidota bacterium]
MKMKFILKALLIPMVLALFSYEASAALPPHWQYLIQSSNHTVLIQPSPSTIVLVDGNAAQTTNCYVGVFYNLANGDLFCGGYAEYTGGMSSITAWGADIGFDGFASGEEFKWKIIFWTGTDTTELSGDAIYGTTFPNTNLFAVNGMSGVTELSFASALNLEAIGWTGPLTSCGLLPNEQVTVSVTNDSSGIVTEPFDLSFSIDSGLTWVTESFTTTVNPGDTIDLTFSQTADFSAFSNIGGVISDSTYNVMFNLSFPNDADTTDNFFSTQITNMQLPVVIATGLDTSYCCYPNTPPIPLSGIPSGGTFSGVGVQGNTMLIGPQGFPFVGVGIYEVYYNFYDQATGCMGADTMRTTVYALPEATFSGYTSYDICQYDTVTFTGSYTGGNFYGNYVDTFTGEFAPLTPGIVEVYYDYTDEFGCFDSSDVETFTVHSLPNAEFVNLQRAYCENGSIVQLEGDPAGGVFSISSGSGIPPSGELDPTQITPGVHSISYLFTDLNNCTDITSKTIRIFPLHDVTLSGLEPEYCKNDVAATLVGIPYGGVYSGGTTTNIFAPNTIGNYTVTYTHDSTRVAYQDTAHCINDASLSTIVHALPEINLASSYTLTPWGDIETCTPDTVILNSGPGYVSYIWNTGDTIQSLSELDYGGYSVSVTNNHECVGHDSLFIGGTDVLLETQISPLSNCTLSASEPLILKYKNVSTKIFATTDKIRFFGQFEDTTSSNLFDNRTIDFNPGDSLEFEIPNVAGMEKLANIGEYEMLVYLHYDESSGDYPDCNLENDTLHLTIINAGLPEVDLGPDMESGSPDTIIIDAGGFETYTWNTGATTSAITG